MSGISQMADAWHRANERSLTDPGGFSGACPLALGMAIDAALTREVTLMDDLEREMCAQRSGDLDDVLAKLGVALAGPDMEGRPSVRLMTSAVIDLRRFEPAAPLRGDVLALVTSGGENREDGDGAVCRVG